MARDVFISYRKEDKASADTICGALEREHIKCWIAPRDVPVGREWAASIVQALKACSSFVLVLSSNSKNAKQIAREAELADNVGLPIITVRIEDVEPPPALQYFLGNVQWLDAFGPNFDAAMGRLADVVRESARSATALTDTPAAEPVETTAPARAAAASASGGAGTASQAPPRSEASMPSSSPSVAPLPSTPVSSRRGVPPYIVVLSVVVLVGLGAVIWWALRRPAPGPNQDGAASASAFGITYMQQRDSGQPSVAYSMTGPAFRKRWPPEKFAAGVEALRRRWGKVTGYVPAGPCTAREGGAYGCEYLVSYSDSTRKKHNLTVAKREEGWAIAADAALSSQ